MNMNAEDFDALRRLLKLKRHELPPPRYFNDFSRQVIERIRTGEREYESETRALSPPWWLRILSAFRDEPIFAGACAGGLCVLLVAGAVYTEKLPPAPGLGGPGAQALAPSAPVMEIPSPLANTSTNSDSSLTGGSIFDVKLSPQPVSGRPVN